MAGSITLSVNFTAAGNLGASAFSTKTLAAVMTGEHVSSVTALVGVAAGALPVGSVVLGGFVVIKNLSGSATVFLGASGVTVTAPVCVGPGDIVTFRSGGVALFGISTEANTRCMITAVSL